MASEKVLIDFDLFERYKRAEKKCHELKSEMEQLKSENEELKKKIDIKQTGSGSQSADLQQQIITQANGIVNDQTQKVLPIDTVAEPNAPLNNVTISNATGSGVGNNEERREKSEKPKTQTQEWYFIGIPKKCSKI